MSGLDNFVAVVLINPSVHTSLVDYNRSVRNWMGNVEVIEMHIGDWFWVDLRTGWLAGCLMVQHLECKKRTMIGTELSNLPLFVVR